MDILADGSLDLSDSVLAQMDIVIASVHSAFTQEPAEMTDRFLKASTIRTFPSSAIPPDEFSFDRDAYQFDIDAVLKAAAKKKIAMELNAYPDRLDLNDRHLRMARNTA